MGFYTHTGWRVLVARLVKVLYNTFLNGAHTMNIEWINETKCVVEYEYEGIENPIATLTARFEREFNVSNGNDIGGLIVYSDSIVYDYENFCGWVK